MSCLVVYRYMISLSLLVVLLSACVEDKHGDIDENLGTIEVSMLIHEDTNNFNWFRDVKIEKGFNAYELTEIVVQGDLESKYYASMFSHLVESIFGKRNEAPNYWIIVLWDDSQQKWTPLPVGADLFSLKDGHVVGWIYAEYGQEVSGLPSP